MSVKVQIIKRLEILKSAIELEDEDIIELQLLKLENENDLELLAIIELVKSKNYSEIGQAIDKYVYGFKDSQLTSHQSEVFNQVIDAIDDVLKSYDISNVSESNNFISLTGSAGVGKTFVTSKLIEEFLKKDYKLLLTTPTHKSLSVAKYMLNTNNIQVPTRTLQSYLDLKLDTDLFQGTKSFQRDKIDAQHDYEKDLDILIVDESSMVSNELLKFIKENLNQEKLKSVLFIGDPYQLPPIDEGQNGVTELPKQFQLTQIVRQAKDSYIKMIANELKDCIKTQKFIPIFKIFDKVKYPQLQLFYDEKDFIDDFTKNPLWYKNKNIAISHTNYQVDEQNRTIRYRYWLSQDIVPNGAIIKGEILVFNEAYQTKFNNSEIIVVSNCEQKFDDNIKIYYWQCQDSLGRGFLVVDPDCNIQYRNYLKNLANLASQTPKYDKELRKKRWRHYFVTKEKYADMKYIFASTIHKVQGSTYDTAYISASSMLSMINRGDLDMAFRLLYVAVTRASKDIKILQ
jgi:hypothetical protein